MISASIVTYKNNLDVLSRTIDSYLSAANGGKLYVIDNSPTQSARLVCGHPTVEYIFNSTNFGYGRAHNMAIRKIMDQSTYHLVLNPDVYFSPHVIKELVLFMDANQDVGLVMPKVLYPDGRLQKLCKLLPTPQQVFGRALLGRFDKIQTAINSNYEMDFSGYDTIGEVPSLSGCFMLLRMETLKKVGLFDERFFLYFEDTDLSRRIQECYKTMFYPHVEIFHVHERGFNKDYKLLLQGMKSACQYFTKWGWLFDKKRDEINDRVIMKYQSNGNQKRNESWAISKS